MARRIVPGFNSDIQYFHINSNNYIKQTNVVNTYICKILMDLQTWKLPYRLFKQEMFTPVTECADRNIIVDPIVWSLV